MLFHEIDAENNASIATDQIVEVFTSPHAHIVHICTHYISKIIHSIGGLGMAKLGFCIQYVGTDPLTCTKEEQTGRVS